MQRYESKIISVLLHLELDHVREAHTYYAVSYVQTLLQIG